MSAAASVDSNNDAERPPVLLGDTAHVCAAPLTPVVTFPRPPRTLGGDSLKGM